MTGDDADETNHDHLSDSEWESIRDHVPLDDVTLAEAVGRNARNIRRDAGLTLDDVARVGREYGARWTTARVVELEKGKRTLTVANLLLLQLSLSRLSGRGVRLAELVDGRYIVELTPRFGLAADGVARAFDGRTPNDSPGVLDRAVLFMEDREVRGDVEQSVRNDIPDATAQEVLTAMIAAQDLAEVRAAKRLGIEVPSLRILARRLWDTDLVSERDARATTSSAQARGRAMRELHNELSSALAALREA